MTGTAHQHDTRRADGFVSGLAPHVLHHDDGGSGGSTPGPQPTVVDHNSHH